MRLEVYESKKPEPPGPTLVKLDQSSDGVYLRIVDKDGVNVTNGIILKLSPKGVYRFSGVDGSLGFAMSDGGSRIRDRPSW